LKNGEGTMENLPRKDGVRNTELALPEKFRGWDYLQASEGAF